MDDPTFIDMDTAALIVAGVLIVLCLVASVRGFRRGAMGAGIGWLAGAAALGFVTYTAATFSLRLF